jgi:hypothetical protein
VKTILPARPRGSRKSWKLVVWPASDVGQYLRDRNDLVGEGWGDPIECQVWQERGGYIRKVIAAYQNGQCASFSYNKGGWQARVWRPEA